MPAGRVRVAPSAMATTLPVWTVAARTGKEAGRESAARRPGFVGNYPWWMWEAVFSSVG